MIVKGGFLRNLYAAPGEEFVFPMPLSDFRPPRTKLLAAVKLRRSRAEAIGKHFRVPRGVARRERKIWAGIIRRCDRVRGHKDYAGRGITVCKRWMTFDNFLVDMGMVPVESQQRLTIERLDNEKGYEPGNCYWGTYNQQARNKRTTRWVVWEGERWSLADLAEANGLSGDLVYGRLYRGETLEEALSRPYRAPKMQKCEG